MTVQTECTDQVSSGREVYAQKSTVCKMMFTKQFMVVYVMAFMSIFVGFFAVGSYKVYGELAG
jgi:hypothetical protein